MTVIFLVFLLIGLFCLWIWSEFHESRWAGISVGACLIAIVFLLTFLITRAVERMQSNAWFGGATQELVSATVNALESGEQEIVIKALRELEESYRPTYEHRQGDADYVDVVKRTVTAIRQNSDRGLKGAPDVETTRPQF